MHKMHGELHLHVILSRVLALTTAESSDVLYGQSDCTNSQSQGLPLLRSADTGGASACMHPAVLPAPRTVSSIEPSLSCHGTLSITTTPSYVPQSAPPASSCPYCRTGGAGFQVAACLPVCPKSQHALVEALGWKRQTWSWRCMPHSSRRSTQSRSRTVPSLVLMLRLFCLKAVPELADTAAKTTLMHHHCAIVSQWPHIS
jgi:hypothetical protein